MQNYDVAYYMQAIVGGQALETIRRSASRIKAPVVCRFQCGMTM